MLIISKQLLGVIQDENRSMVRFCLPFCYIGKRHLEAAIKERTDVEN